MSFVIPAYNEESYIGRCLFSVLKETKKYNDEFEIIVVNNASQDKTKEVALGFPGIKVIDEPKKGLTRARQAGFLASSGEIIANIDADTILTPEWIPYVKNEFSKNKKLVALSGPFIYYDLPGFTNFWVKVFYRIGFLSYLTNKFILKIGSAVQGGNFALRRSALEKIGGYNLAINFYGEDTDIARRLNPLGDVKFTFKLPIYASGRRLVKEGAVVMGVRYAMNYIWTTFFKKPFDTKPPLAVDGNVKKAPRKLFIPKILSGLTVSILVAVLFLISHFSTLANFENSSKNLVQKIHNRISASQGFQKLEKEMRPIPSYP